MAQWPELETAARQVTSGVIPRLQSILQSEGRELKPSFTRGGCWGGNLVIEICNACGSSLTTGTVPGNVGTFLETGDAISFVRERIVLRP